MMQSSMVWFPGVMKIEMVSCILRQKSYDYDLLLFSGIFLKNSFAELKRRKIPGSTE